MMETPRISDSILTTLEPLQGSKLEGDTVECVYKGYSCVIMEHIWKRGRKGKILKEDLPLFRQGMVLAQTSTLSGCPTSSYQVT
jgi:hypothetical protein